MQGKRTSAGYMRGDFPFRSVEDIEYANRRAGFYFFEASAMRFFNSRILDGVHGGRYFVTSEKHRYGDPRLYTVREALPSGRIESVSEFQEFGTAKAARRCAEKFAAAGSVYLAGAAVWNREHGSGDWRITAKYYGLTDKRDRLELRRAIRAYEAQS